MFADANVFIYAFGAAHAYRDPCRALVARIGRGEIAAETSTEVVQEVVHFRRRRAGTGDAIDRAREILALGIVVHEFTPADLDMALTILGEHEGLPARDAFHAATARNREIGVILSADRDFDALGSLERIDPLDESAVARLSG